MLRPAAAVLSALLLSACVTTGMAPIVPASPSGGPPLDPAVVSYLANGTWRATKDPASATVCSEGALPSFGFVRHKGQIHVVRVDNGALLAALFTMFVSVLAAPNEILASAQSDGAALNLQSTKGAGRDRSHFTLRFTPTGPDTMDLAGATSSVVRDGLREDRSDGRVTHFRRCPDAPEQKKRA
jgi:hypothetical protein